MTTVPEYIERARATLTDAMQQALADEAIREALTAERDAQDAELRDLRAYSEAQAGQIAALEQTVTEQAARIAELEGGGEPPAPEPRHLWEVLVDGLRVRSSPDTSSLANVTARLNRGDVVEGLSVEGDWLHHTEGWSAIRSGASVYLQRRDDVVIPPAPDEPYHPSTTPHEAIPPHGLFAIGAGTADRAPWQLGEREMEVVRRAGFNALKLMAPGLTQAHFDMIKDYDSDMMIIVNLRGEDDYKHSPAAYVDALAPEIELAYQNGVRLLEKGNEENLKAEGWGRFWRSGADIADYHIAVSRLITQRWPGTKMILGALSPSPGLPAAQQYHTVYNAINARMAARGFDPGMRAIHVYWQEPGGEEAAHQAVVSAAREYPDDLIFVTEASRPKGTDYAEKAAETAWFLDQQTPGGVKAKLVFVLDEAPQWDEESLVLHPEFAEAIRPVTDRRQIA